LPVELHETLRRVLDIVRYLSERPGASLSELSRDLGLNVETARRTLRALEQVGLVRREVGGMPRTARHYLTDLGKCIASCLSSASSQRVGSSGST